MANRYMEHRTRMEPEAAALAALQTAGGSVITSALILTAAGTAEGIMSSIGSVSQIGLSFRQRSIFKRTYRIDGFAPSLDSLR